MVREVYICRCKLLLSYLQNPYICLPVWQLSTNKDSTNAYLYPNQALLGAQLSTFSYERYKLLKYSLLQVCQDGILSVPMTVSLDFLEYEFSGQKIQNGILSAKSSPPLSHPTENASIMFFLFPDEAFRMPFQQWHAPPSAVQPL